MDAKTVGKKIAEENFFFFFVTVFPYIFLGNAIRDIDSLMNDLGGIIGNNYDFIDYIIICDKTTSNLEINKLIEKLPKIDRLY